MSRDLWLQLNDSDNHSSVSFPQYYLLLAHKTLRSSFPYKLHYHSCIKLQMFLLYPIVELSSKEKEISDVPLQTWHRMTAVTTPLVFHCRLALGFSTTIDSILGQDMCILYSFLIYLLTYDDHSLWIQRKMHILAPDL